jgi:hypothetical protein
LITKPEVHVEDVATLVNKAAKFLIAKFRTNDADFGHAGYAAVAA